MPAFWSKLILRGHYNTRWTGSENNKEKHKRKKPKQQIRDQNSGSNVKLEASYYPNHVSSQDDQASAQYQCTRPRLSGVFPELNIGRTPRGSKDYSPVHYTVADVLDTDGATGGMNHYLPKITQNLYLSGVLEGNKQEDYFQSCRPDNILDNFGRLMSHDDDVSNDGGDDDGGVSLEPSSKTVNIPSDKLDSVDAELRVVRPYTNGALDASYPAEEYTHYDVAVADTSQQTQNDDEWLYTQTPAEPEWTVVDVLY